MVLFGWTNDGGGLQPSTAARPAPGHKRRDVNKRKGGKRHTGADHRQACTVGLGPDIIETTWSIQKVIFKSYMRYTKIFRTDSRAHYKVPSVAYSLHPFHQQTRLSGSRLKLQIVKCSIDEKAIHVTLM